MEINVEIFDIGPNDPEVLWHLFESELKRLIRDPGDPRSGWVYCYGLQNGASPNKVIARMKTVFLAAVDDFVADTVLNGYAASPRSADIKLKLPEEQISSHRYLPMVTAVCEVLSKGFQVLTYPTRYMGSQTEFRLVTPMKIDQFSVILIQDIVSCFCSPNREKMYSEIMTIFENLDIRSGILVKAVATPDHFNTAVHTISTVGAQKWAINAFNAGVNAASELGRSGWVPIIEEPNTFDL
jgi:hypothetical protein